MFKNGGHQKSKDGYSRVMPIYVERPVKSGKFWVRVNRPIPTLAFKLS
jgi:hypothetical protein